MTSFSRYPLRTITALALLLSWAPVDSTASAEPQRPNLIILLADDLGYSDIGCFGSEIDTPHLDALAAGGLRFTSFYNTARCCPTRAALLTGMYPHQAGIGRMVRDEGAPGYRGRLNPTTPTIAEMLFESGYRTYMVGKWHVTPFDYATRETPDVGSWPLARGFERFYGTLAGGGSYFDPCSLMDEGEFCAPDPEAYYYTDALGERAAKNVRESAASDRPFFMYVAFTAPHWPLHATEEDIAIFAGRYDAGWDELRRTRLARMKELGVVDDRFTLTPRDRRVKAWEETPDHAWQSRRMEVYAAQVYAMDRAIGRIVEALKETGRLADTLILFLADNGGCDELLRLNNAEQRRHYYANPVPNLRTGNDPSLAPGPRDTFASYGVGWANASNTPFRLYKKRIHEGGSATPLVVHWPKGIRAKGEFRRQVGHVIDLMPTCLDAAGLTATRRRRDGAPLALEGKSLLTAFDDRPLERDALYWEHFGNAGIREGDWKLVREGGKPWELYDLNRDPTEMNDLAADHPEKVAALEKKYDAWESRCKVVPRPGKQR